jgi:hypothetical protein
MHRERMAQIILVVALYEVEALVGAARLLARQGALHDRLGAVEHRA